MSQNQHCHKQGSDHPGTAFDFLEVTAEDTDHDVGDQAESDTVGDPRGIGTVTKGIGKHIGIDHQNIDHGKEGGHAGNKLRFVGSTPFFQFKKTLQPNSPFQVMVFVIPCFFVCPPFSSGKTRK